MRILLLDDDARHRRAGTNQLRGFGHEVVALYSYSEAIGLAHTERFDVAFIDLLMPAERDTLGQKGMEYLGREIAVGFPLIILLAHANVGAVGCITDTNHHDHPMSAMVDHFRGKLFEVNGKPVGVMHAHLTPEGGKDWQPMIDLLKL